MFFLLVAVYVCYAILFLCGPSADSSESYTVVEGDKAHVLRKIEGRRAWIEIEILKCRDLDLPELKLYKDPRIASGVSSDSVLRLDFDEAKHADLIGRDGCTVLVESRGMPVPNKWAWAVFWFVLAGVCLWQSLFTVGQTITLSDEGITLRTLLFRREARWEECSWFDLWGKYRVVIGRASGRALSMPLGFLRQRRDLVVKIKQHLGEPTRRKQKIVQTVLVSVLFGGSAMVGLFSTPVGFLTALAFGVATAFCFVSAERDVSKRAVRAWLIGLSVLFLAAAAALSKALWGWSWTALLSTIAIFGGWFPAFYLTRMHEGFMRRIIGDDWARPARPGECLD
jgi:hypothetical protein